VIMVSSITAARRSRSRAVAAGSGMVVAYAAEGLDSGELELAADLAEWSRDAASSYRQTATACPRFIEGWLG